MIKTLFIFFLLIINYGVAFNTNSATSGNNNDSDTVYSNPIIQRSLPDPTIIKADDGNFYLYATEDIRNTPIYKSADLVNWNYAGTAYIKISRPDGESDGELWASGINYINEKNVFCYSITAPETG